MRGLINGQTLGIDNHRRGQPIDWDDTSADIHLDKRTNFGKNKRATIKIPINSDSPPSYELNGQRGDDSFKRRLEKEVNEALGDKATRDRFIREMIEWLKNITSDLSNREKAQHAVRRIAKGFGLNEEIVREMSIYAENNLLSFTSLHRDIEGKIYFIRLTRFRIWIGELSGRHILRLIDELL